MRGPATPLEGPNFPFAALDLLPVVTLAVAEAAGLEDLGTTQGSLPGGR